MSIRNLSGTTKNILILVGLGTLVFLTWYLYSIVAPFLVALVIAYLINPVVAWLDEKKLLFVNWLRNKNFRFSNLLAGDGNSRTTSVVTVFLLGLLMFFVFVVPFTFQMAADAKEMGSKLSKMTKESLNEQRARFRNKCIENNKEKVQIQNSVMENGSLTDVASASAIASSTGMTEIEMVLGYEVDFAGHKFSLGELILNNSIHEYLAEAVVKIKDGITTGLSNIIGFAGSAFTSMFNMFLIPVLVFYILLDMDSICDGFTKLIPKAYRPRTISIFGKIDEKLSAMIRGQCLENIIFAVMMAIGLGLSGLKFAVFLGLVAGIANFIPYLGGFFTAVLAVLVALVQCGISPSLVTVLVGVAVAISIIQFIDCWILQPYIVGENAGLKPLTIMLALTVAGSVAGIVGMLLAVPITLIIKVLFLEFYDDLYGQESSQDEQQ